MPFVGQAYSLKSVNVDAQRCVNLYPDPVQGGNSKSDVVLKNTAGLTLKATLNGTRSVRGLYQTSTSRFFGICGAVLNEILPDHTVINHGSISTGIAAGTDTTVGMVDNGAELIIVDGTNGWIFDLNTDTLTVISDTDFPQNATHVTYLDGYFIVNKPETGRFYWSDVDDGFTWNSLNFATSEGSPDNLISLVELGRNLWLMGSHTYEVFYNTGDSSDTFLRIEGTKTDIGIGAKYSLAKMDESIYWLGANDAGHGQIWMNQGYEPIKISTNAIDEVIQSYSIITNATAFCYQQDGNKFYQISFPTPQKTWVYDLTTRMWHEKSYRNPTTGAEEAHRAQSQAFFNGNIYVGDRANGKLYTYDLDVYTDNGDIILRNRTSPHYWGNLERVFYSSFQVDMETGVGLSTGQGSDPVMLLESSNDGGHTFGTGRTAEIGKQGAYRTRLKWNRLGASRDRIFRLTTSDAIPITILNAHIE